MFDRRQWLGAAGAVALACTAGIVAAQAPAPAAAGTPVKIGYVYVSPIGDAGWTFQHDQGRKQMEAALGGKVQSKFVENVAEGPDAERVIREMAQSGNAIIFTTSFGYMNPTEKVAKQFPNVKFAHATGYKTGPNFANYNARFYEGRYLTGIIAGRMTTTNIMGYVNPRVDELFELAAGAVKDEDRQRHYSEVQRILTDEVPVCWILEMSWPNFVNRTCHDVIVSGVGPAETYERAWMEA